MNIAAIMVFAGLNAEGLATSSKIKDVTIYLKGARVERTASLNLVPGNNEIVFENLSNFIDESSIEVQGQGNATILSVNYRINYLKMQQQTETARHLKLSLDSSQLRLEYIGNEIAVLDQEALLLQANYKVGVNEKTQFANEVEEWSRRYHTRVLEIKNKLTILHIKEKEITILNQELQNQLVQANSSNRQPSGEIIVKVSAASGGKADFSFDYYVATAGWTPLYSLRAQNTTDPLKLDYDALVSQQSGEIWKDIKMTLSTGNPMLAGNKPELGSWYLNIAEINTRRNRWDFGDESKTTGLDRDALFKKSEDKTITTMYNQVAVEANIPMAGASDFTTMKQSQLNVSFDISLPYTIAADGTPQQVRIQQASIPAIYEYAAAPKLDNDAFLLARATGWEEFNLLPGTANLYFEGAYIGKSYINPTVTNDTLNLSFGRDKKINIERKLLRDFNKKAFLGKNTTQNFVYEISVKNTKYTAVTLNMEDQVPVSQNKEIEVSVNEISGADYDKKTGKLQWKLSLNPNEIKKIKMEYSVKYPVNKIVTGL